MAACANTTDDGNDDADEKKEEKTEQKELTPIEKIEKLIEQGKTAEAWYDLLMLAQDGDEEAEKKLEDFHVITKKSTITSPASNGVKECTYDEHGNIITENITENGNVTKLELLAVDLGLGLGLNKGRVGNPRPAENSAILERYAEMSAPYGVKMTINGNVATVEI